MNFVQAIMEKIKPEFLRRWRNRSRELQPPSDTEDVEEAYRKGYSQGYWNGVADGVDVGVSEGLIEVEGEVLKA